jgi:vesicle-associated membrane protein 4
MANLVKFLGVGRLVKNDDGTFAEGEHQLIAAKTNKADEGATKEYKKHVTQIMDKGAAKLTVDKRIKLTSDQNDYDLHVCATAVPGEECVVAMFVVTDSGFGKAQSISQLFDEFKAGFFRTNTGSDIAEAKSGGSVNKATQKLFDSIFAKFGSSKLAEVQEKVEKVKDVMRDNVNQALQNVERLEDMEQKSEQFEEQARQFNKGATNVKGKMRCSYYKSTALLVLIVVVILVVIIAPIAVKFSE